MASAGLDASQIQKIFNRAGQLVFQKAGGGTAVNVIFVTSLAIQKLNWKFRQINEPTDVMAFPIFANKILGEIYICLEEARRNARNYRQRLEHELLRLFIHGGLHLLGYQDGKKVERDKMWQKQEAVIKRVIRGD